MTESFPRQQARTRRFTLGLPRAFHLSPDGQRIVFLRSKAGSDPVTCLWELNLASGEEWLVADPRTLGADDENLSQEERARRERMRETAAGIVGFATDHDVTMAVFALSGQVFTVPLGVTAPAARLVATRTPALDPRVSPSGELLGYVHAGALRVVSLETGEDRVVAGESGVTFGLAEFVAAEEMGRTRGYWWAADGSGLLIARVDESAVARWHIADPANPDRMPAEVAYPAAGTPNAGVSLVLATRVDPHLARSPEEEFEIDTTPLAVAPVAGVRLSPLRWDHARFPYLVNVAWDKDLLIVVQSRDQRLIRLFNGLTGETIREDSDPQWTDVIDGVPAQLDDGSIVWTEISDDTRRLLVAQPGELAGAAPVTPAGLQVRRVLGTDGNDVLFQASTDPTEVGVWRYGPDGLREVATAPGVHTAVAGGGTTVLSSRTMDSARLEVSVRSAAQEPAVAVITSLAEEPNLPLPAPRFLEAGPNGIHTAVLFPSWHEPGTRLPVLMDPYGGPAMQRVSKTASLFLPSQWFAEQGFAVVVADGRGTPGRSPSWDRTIAGDFATAALADQVAALEAAAGQFADLDTSRVAMRGWSHGGYLSALAVLRRPDVFHAAVAGAPVTDWRLYDTHYTERYLGHPASNPAAYQVSSVIDDPERAVKTQVRPLLIIHGMADDNVFVAHSLRLSSALLAAGYPHQVLPLSGVTHMTPQEVVAENMLLLQVSFLKEALGM
jgi:dipeptidyl-peptidase-4